MPPNDNISTAGAQDTALLHKVVEARVAVARARQQVLNSGALEVFTVWWISHQIERARTALESISAAFLESISAEAGHAMCAMQEANRMCISIAHELQVDSQLSVVITAAVSAAAELLVICCSLGLDDCMQAKGMPNSLQVRLAAACGRCVHDGDKDFWSKLGKAKYEVFTPGRKWGGRRRPNEESVGSAESAAASQLSFVDQAAAVSQSAQAACWCQPAIEADSATASSIEAPLDPSALLQILLE